MIFGFSYIQYWDQIRSHKNMSTFNMTSSLEVFPLPVELFLCSLFNWQCGTMFTQHAVLESMCTIFLFLALLTSIGSYVECLFWWWWSVSMFPLHATKLFRALYSVQGWKQWPFAHPGSVVCSRSSNFLVSFFFVSWSFDTEIRILFFLGTGLICGLVFS